MLWLNVSKQKEMDKTKTQRDYEEKLIVSAWYNMVRALRTGLGFSQELLDRGVTTRGQHRPDPNST